jgi:hypothetical protein
MSSSIRTHNFYDHGCLSYLQQIHVHYDRSNETCETHINQNTWWCSNALTGYMLGCSLVKWRSAIIKIMKESNKKYKWTIHPIIYSAILKLLSPASSNWTNRTTKISEQEYYLSCKVWVEKNTQVVTYGSAYK